ncbi:MAG: hypothetical protein JO089_04610 [Alphaproteobacteria bacterium]|nr:hypothetical protein [Alphaproteobacteria bacterium]
MQNPVALDQLSTFEFILEKAIEVVYVSITDAHSFVVRKCEVLAKAVTNSLSSNSVFLLTHEGYKADMVQKLLQLKNAPPALAPSGETEFLAWLNQE